MFDYMFMMGGYVLNGLLYGIVSLFSFLFIVLLIVKGSFTEAERNLQGFSGEMFQL